MVTLRSALLLIGVLLAGWADAQEKKKPLAIEDLYLMESVKSPTLFPKEEKLVYERVWIDAKTKQERHSLWLVTFQWIAGLIIGTFWSTMTRTLHRA